MYTTCPIEIQWKSGLIWIICSFIPLGCTKIEIDWFIYMMQTTNTIYGVNNSIYGLLEASPSCSILILTIDSTIFFTACTI